ncbi:MAG: glycerol-3-phosphate 1-O-acyltransferase PlsY [Leptolyngbyaceae bacterium]|nr:glycerol-3-phosphate 1-O-acyltransferase PlsY [Leptolyngbyaceae bacterium]
MVVWLSWGILALVLAYFLGSLPTGYLAGQWLKGIDIREHGSGSTGATNVLRTLGKGPGLAVLLLDMLKGALSVLLTRWLYTQPFVATSAPAGIDISQWVPWIVIFVALAAILGHSRSIWLKFTGGKSVATSLGILFAIYWPMACIALGVFSITVAISRMVSLGSILGAISVPIVMAIAHRPLPLILFGVAAAAYITATHRRNIQRILAGTESRLGQKAQDPQSTASSN